MIRYDYARVLENSGTSGKEDHREKADVVLTREEERRRVRAKNNGGCIDTRKETVRKT